jgi:hypothetical protein
MSELVVDNNQTDTRLGQTRAVSDCSVSNLPPRLMSPPVPKTSSWPRTTSAATRSVDKHLLLRPNTYQGRGELGRRCQ